MITSKPAASHSAIVSRVLRVTPPSVPDVGDGRMKADDSCASRFMRVLSPRIEPPVRFDVGSTASTATRWPAATRFMPNSSMVVDLPTPGTPVTPSRNAPPVAGSNACSSFCAVRLVLAPGAFDERDGARQHGPVARAHAVDIGVERRAGGGDGGHQVLLESATLLIMMEKLCASAAWGRLGASPSPCRRFRRFIVWRASITAARGRVGDARTFRPVYSHARGSGRTHSLWDWVAPYVRALHRRAAARPRRPLAADRRPRRRHAAAEPGHARRSDPTAPRRSLRRCRTNCCARPNAMCADKCVHRTASKMRPAGRERRPRQPHRSESRRGHGLELGAGVLRHRSAGAGRPQASAIQLGARSPARARARLVTVPKSHEVPQHRAAVGGEDPVLRRDDLRGGGGSRKALHDAGDQEALRG